MSTKYGRLLVDVYLSALSFALDLHINICEQIHGYVGAVTTTPLQPSRQKKFTMLVWQGDMFNVILRKTPAAIVTNFDITQDHPYIANLHALKTPTKKMVEKQQKTHEVEITEVHKKKVIKMYEQTYNITVPMDEEDNSEKMERKHVHIKRSLQPRIMMKKTQSNNLNLIMNNLSRTLQDRNSLLKLKKPPYWNTEKNG